MALIPARLQWSDDGKLASLDYDDVYFQRQQGFGESTYVFIEKNNLPARFAAVHDDFYIGELGFGSGLNFLLTAKLWRETAPAAARLHYVSFEKHPITHEELSRIYATWRDLAPLTDAVLSQYPPLIEGFHRLQFGNITLTLILGDVTKTMPQVRGRFDAWYLDGFSSRRNPAMWGADVIAAIGAMMPAGATLSTFSAARHVLDKLGAAGFSTQKVKGYGVKRKMTVAVKTKDIAPPPPKPRRITVIGAGIAGCSAAYAFARRGYAVRLYDRRDDVAMETSGNPAGIVYPKLTVDASAMGDYHSHAFCFTRRLLDELKIPSWKACGVLHLAQDDDDRHRMQEMDMRRGFPADYALFRDDGIFQPMAGMVSPREFCVALSSHPLIEKHFGTALGDIEADDGGITVIAAGNASKNYPQASWLPLQSLRGQVTMVRQTPASAALDHVICHDGYITPALEDGTHCIGATFQREEQDDFSTRPADDVENLHKLNACLPQFGFTPDHICSSRAGFRATTPDKLPMAGPCPDYDAALRDKVIRHHEGVYLSTGFGAHGMTGAPLAGEIIACLVHGDPLPVPADLLAHLLPERFILRDIKRRKI